MLVAVAVLAKNPALTAPPLPALAVAVAVRRVQIKAAVRMAAAMVAELELGQLTARLTPEEVAGAAVTLRVAAAAMGPAG